MTHPQLSLNPATAAPIGSIRDLRGYVGVHRYVRQRGIVQERVQE